jgi:hypothetical protein
VVVSLCDAHLLGGFLGGCRFVAFVSDPPEPLALELGEPDAVGGVRHVEVEHRPDEGETAPLAGEAADHLGASLHLAERSLERVGIPYEIGLMPPGTPTGLDALSASGLVSTVRPSGTGASGSNAGWAGRSIARWVSSPC